MTTLLVTGGAGFIGSNLVDMLIRKGYEVVVIDDLSTGSLSNLSIHEDSKALTIIQKGINEISPNDLDGIDAVFHLAARVNVIDSIENPLEDARVNYQGTLTVLECSRKAGIDKVLFTSSAAVYGDTKEIPTSESAEKFPLSPYGNHKLSSGNMLRLYNEIHGMKNVVLRLFNIYGPRQDPSNPYSGVISKFMEWASRGHDLTIFGDGGQTRDFVYVKDVARALTSCYEKDLSGTFNIGTGVEVSINELAEKVIGITNSESGIIRVERRPGEIYRSVADNNAIRENLKWVPDTSMDIGLEEYWRTI